MITVPIYKLDAWKIWLKIKFSKYSIDFQFIFVPKDAALLLSDE